MRDVLAAFCRCNLGALNLRKFGGHFRRDRWDKHKIGVFELTYQKELPRQLWTQEHLNVIRQPPELSDQ